MKRVGLFALLLCSLPGFSQNWAPSSWARTQTTDKLSGDSLVIYSLEAQPVQSGRRATITAVCDKTAGRFNFGYFTDDMVHVDAEFAHPDSQVYPTIVRYKDPSKVRSAATTVQPDFRTINLDPGFMSNFTTGQSLVISYQSERGYAMTDEFSGSLPLQYMGDCYTDKQLKKLAKARK